jgi:hypothetical protein
MALDKSKLKTELESWMNTHYDNLNDAANAFADAYNTYALDAYDISGDTPLSVNKAGIVSAILSLTLNETAATSAIKFQTGLVNYWTGGTFKLLTPPAGTIAPEISAIVTASIIPPAISSTLTTIFTDLNKDTTVSTKATQISNLFDTATKAVIVTCIGTLANPPYSLAVPGVLS